jgi:hypothetical protein
MTELFETNVEISRKGQRDLEKVTVLLLNTIKVSRVVGFASRQSNRRHHGNAVSDLTFWDLGFNLSEAFLFATDMALDIVSLEFQLLATFGHDGCASFQSHMTSCPSAKNLKKHDALRLNKTPNRPKPPCPCEIQSALANR